MSAVAESVTPGVLRTVVGAFVRLAPRDSLTNSALTEELSAQVASCIATRHTKIIVDLSAATLVDSAALEALLDAHELLLRHGGWLKYSGASPLLEDIFGICGISHRIRSLEGAGEAPQAAESRSPARIGDILVELGFLTEKQVSDAAALQERMGMRLGNIVVEKGWVSEQNMLTALSRQLNLPVVRLRAGTFDPAIAEVLDHRVARRLMVFPLFRVRGELFFATSTPQSAPLLAEVEERTGLRARPVLAARGDIRGLIEQGGDLENFDESLISDVDEDFELVENHEPEDYTVIDEVAAGSPVINLVNSIIQRSVRDGASDIHIEPSRKLSRVRYRIDGVLYEYRTLKSELHPALVSRLKVMANLDIAERRLPQDGRIQVQTQGRSIDLRFSSLPGMYGEKIVLRILDKRNAILDIDRLGMAQGNLDLFKQLLGRSHGLVLVTGPTGSGKTTSLYAALNFLNSIEKNIVTIEDPVEYQLDVINQNAVQPAIGLDFSRVLKHVLRQDPDIIMVGEIREHETAQIAVQAALTGHLVLSTLHTNDSVGAITRLIDMGVEPYLLSSALIGVVAQRLVRAVCPACKTTSLAPPDLVQRFGWGDLPAVQLARGRGCPECYDSGFRGRLGIHEVLDADEELQQIVLTSPTRDELSAYLRRRTIPSLLDDGLVRAREQLTTIEEVSRAVSL